MAGKRMARYHGEYGLSEVVGIVLLIAVIISAFSVWLTYGIPVTGRSNEIAQMSNEQNEFTSYKIGIDSLWTNGQTSTEQSNTFTMGTSGQTSQGNNGFLPILQPVGSSGTIMINNRTPTSEWLNISSYSYITNLTNELNDTPISITPTIQSTSFQHPPPPNHLLINITGLNNVNALQYQEPLSPSLTLNSSRSIIVNGTDNTGTAWKAQINLTPRYSLYQEYALATRGTGPTGTCTPATSSNGTVINLGTGAGECLQPLNLYNFTGTDITLSVFKNQTNTLNNLILYQMVSSSVPSGGYVIDLLNPTYNLVSNIQGSSVIWYQKYDPINDMAVNATAQYAYWYPPVYNYSIPLGALQYNANNNYFIPQTYYYQAGGVFLSQSDGVTNILPPEITFSYNQSGSVGVNIIGIAIDKSDGGSIGGTSPVKIGTSVDSTLGNLPYAPLTNNTMNVTINFTASTGDPLESQTIQMWKNFFLQEANTTAGIPNNGTFYTVGNTTTGAYIFVKGINNPSNVASINLMTKVVNLSVSILSIGGA